MTVLNTTIRNGPYYPNGVTVAFPFTFRAIDKEDVQVVRVAADGSVTFLPDALFNVTLTGNGGSALFTVAPAAGDPLYVQLDPSFSQEISLENEGAFLPEVITEALDRSAQRSLWLRERVLRAFSIPLNGDFSGLYPVVLADGTPGFTAGTGSDPALRTDLGLNGGPIVGVAQTGVGGVKRSLTALINDQPLHPESFGAVGDGVIDDTLAWQRCITRAKLTGQAIEANGIYQVVQVNLDGTGIRLRGNGLGKFVKKPSTTGKLLNITGDSCTVEGFAFDATTQLQIDSVAPEFRTANDIIRIQGAKRCVVRRNTIIGSGGLTGPAVNIGGGGIAIYQGSDNLVEFNGIYGVRDNSVFVGDVGANRNRVLNNICDGTYAQNNIFVTASPASGAVPGVFIYDNVVSGNICRNSGDTNIEFGIHTVRSICQGNNLMSAINPAILMRDSTYFVISGNLIQATTGKLIDMISVVPATEASLWECYGTISDNICVGSASRSAIYVGQSRMKVVGNLCSRPIQDETIALDGSTLGGVGVFIADGVAYANVENNNIRGYANGVALNGSGSIGVTHPGCTITGNTFEMNDICINFYGCVGDVGSAISGNIARGVRTNFLKGDNCIIVPTTTYPKAQLRCFNNAVDLPGFTQVGVMFSAGISPSDGLLTSPSAGLALVPETVDGVTAMAAQSVFGTGHCRIRFVGGARSATYVIDVTQNAAVKQIGSADMFGSDGTTAGWSLNGFSGAWNLVRRASATGSAPRYFVYDFTAI